MATSSRFGALTVQEKRSNKDRKRDKRDNDKQAKHFALMAHELPSVESVVEEAIRKMLQQQTKMTIPSPCESSSSSSRDTDHEEISSSSSSSRDIDHEVSSTLNLNLIIESDDEEPSVQTVPVPSPTCTNNLEIEFQNNLSQELDRLRNCLSVAEQNLNDKDKLIKTLQQNLSISEFSVKSYKAQVIEFGKLKVVNNDFETEKLKNEISHLKIEVLNLKVENKSLKSTCASISPSRFDFDKLPLGQKPNDKSGLGFKKTKINKPKNNYNKNGSKNAFIYQNRSNYNTFKNSNFNNYRNNRFNFQNNFRQTHNDNHFARTEYVYKRGPDGYFYEIANKPFIPKTYCAKTVKPKCRKAEYTKQHYHSHFVKSTVKTSRPTCSFCNYCCKVGHISLECPLRKPIMTPKVAWLRKDRDTRSASTSKMEVPKST